jgi:hypothetical protein
MAENGDWKAGRHGQKSSLLKSGKALRGTPQKNVGDDPKKSLDSCPKVTYKISMKTTQTAENVLRKLNPILSKVSEAVEIGVTVAREYFEEHKKDFDPWLFSDLFRNEVGERLSDIQESGTLSLYSYRRISLPNNGLEFWFGDYRIKILKSSDGRLPPGASIARNLFYSQSMLPSMEDAFGTKLVIVWEIDESYALAKLQLVCPKNPSSYPELPEEHWEIDIPHAATTIAVEPDSEETPDLDLPIAPLRKKNVSEDE